jgi:hypothetical protein
MLKRAWYLTDADFFAEMRNAPRLPADDFLGELTALFGDDAGYSPAHTAAATYVALAMTEHLGEAIAHPEASLCDNRELIRLLGGLNLLTAHLAQAVQRLAYQVDQGSVSGLADTPADAVGPITVSLARGGAICEMVAGYLKEAHLLLQLADRPAAFRRFLKHGSRVTPAIAPKVAHDEN